jgi:DNA-binding NarL/FixJ family response regulator
MTTGFQLIFDHLRLSRKQSGAILAIPADEELLGLLGELAEGQEYSLEELAAILLKKAAIEQYQTTSLNMQHWQELSQRQQEVAALVCLGYTNAEIAEKLNISFETVKTHVSEILRKFNVRGRHQLRYMLRRWNFGGFDHPKPAT